MCISTSHITAGIHPGPRGFCRQQQAWNPRPGIVLRLPLGAVDRKGRRLCDSGGTVRAGDATAAAAASPEACFLLQPLRWSAPRPLQQYLWGRWVEHDAEAGRKEDKEGEAQEGEEEEQEEGEEDPRHRGTSSNVKIVGWWWQRRDSRVHRSSRVRRRKRFAQGVRSAAAKAHGLRLESRRLMSDVCRDNGSSGGGGGVAAATQGCRE